MVTRLLTVSESTEIDTTPTHVWSAVSDVARHGEWSPECTGATLLTSGPVAVGSRFQGHNAIGRRSWSTTCTVVVAEPGRRFAFEVAAIGPTSRWTYVLEPSERGTRVTETWTDLRRGVRGRVTALVGRLYGVRDRAEHNRLTMRATLLALKSHLEDAQRS